MLANNTLCCLHVSMAKPSKGIPLSFRLDLPLDHKLRFEADQLGLSPHRYAEQIVTRAIQDENRLDVLNQLHQVQNEVADLRETVATSLITLVLNFIPDATDEQVADLKKRLGL